jgi:acyl-CoA synthetase (AMP-forming)/AMP-acid ligase II
VRQSAVTGRPATNGTEEIVAFVELRPEVDADVESLRAYAAQRLASYKQPSEVVILKALPTTAGGKIAKRELLSARPETSVAATA